MNAACIIPQNILAWLQGILADFKFKREATARLKTLEDDRVSLYRKIERAKERVAEINQEVARTGQPLAKYHDEIVELFISMKKNNKLLIVNQTLTQTLETSRSHLGTHTVQTRDHKLLAHAVKIMSRSTGAQSLNDQTDTIAELGDLITEHQDMQNMYDDVMLNNARNTTQTSEYTTMEEEAEAMYQHMNLSKLPDAPVNSRLPASEKLSATDRATLEACGNYNLSAATRPPPIENGHLISSIVQNMKLNEDE